MKGESKTAQASHVAVIAFPFTSHVGSLLSLSRYLAGMTGDVSFSFFTTASSLGGAHIPAGEGVANFSFHFVPDGLPEGFVFSSERLAEPIQHFMTSAPGHLRRMLAGLQPRVTCVLSDAFLTFSEALAEEAGVPILRFWASGATSLYAQLNADRVRETIGMQELTPENVDAPVDCIPGLPFLRLRDLPDDLTSRPGSISSLFDEMVRTFSHSSTLIINTFEPFEPFSLTGLRTAIAACLTVGPLLLLTDPARTKEDEHGCIAFLDAHPPNSVVYVSFGTITDLFLPQHELTALAEGLESSGAPFLWSLKPGAQAYLPPGFGDRVKGRGLIVPWAPQAAVLSHGSTGAHMTHSGWNSVLETVAGGRVPLIARPLFADQGLICRLVEVVWGMGVRVRGGIFTRESVEEAVHVVMHGEEGRAMREKVGEWKRFAQQAVAAGGTADVNMKALVEIVRGKA